MEKHFRIQGKEILVTEDPAAAGRKENSRIPVIGVGLQYHGAAALVVENWDQITEPLLLRVSCRFYHRPMQIAQTGRLSLWEMSEEEIPELCSLYEQTDTTYIAPCEYAGESAAQRHARFAAYRRWQYEMQEQGLWNIWLGSREAHCLIGRAGLEEGELQYMIATRYCGRGYAEEACRAILQYAEEAGMQEVALRIRQQNTPSLKLAAKLGFQPVPDRDSGEVHFFIKRLGGTETIACSRDQRPNA